MTTTNLAQTDNNDDDVMQSGEEQLRRSRILLVDDDEVFSHLIRRYLKSDPTHEHIVLSASSIQQATLAFSLDTFDCVIVDYVLPDGCGAGVIDNLREACGEKCMPCTIVLTGQSGEQAAIDSVRAGANDFLTKGGLTQTALCRAVNNAVEKCRLRKMHFNRVKELEIANTLLRQRNEEIQRFYHTVSHEVKTPLTAIQEFVSIVNDGLAGEVGDEQKTLLEYALQSCDQIKSHFNELLELSRFDTGKMKVTLEPSSIYPVFDHCIAAATPAAVAKNIQLEIDDEPDLPMVLMQSNRIMQVLSNLINNALRFTPARGMVVIKAQLTDSGSRLRLSVKDTGCGIKQEDIKRVFDRLYQVTPSSEMNNEFGMGLGLTISAQIAKLHGSRIDVDSKLGEGSEFSLELDTC